MHPLPVSERLRAALADSDPYLPGRSARPSGDDEVHAIAARAPDPTDPSTWQDNEAWIAGIFLYANGWYWEAHEVWEPVWMQARPNSRERLLCQAVIQLANAALKQRLGWPRAAMRLSTIAHRLLDDIAAPTGPLMGIAVADLSAAVRAYRDALAVSDFAGPVPGINLAPTSKD